MPPRASRARCFVITDFDVDHVDSFWQSVLVRTRCRAVVVGPRENCPDTGRAHHHVVLYFDGPRSLSIVRSEVSPRYIELGRGGYEVARRYACKQGPPHLELGDPPRSGDEGDLEAAVHAVRDSGRLRDVLRETPTSEGAIRLATQHLNYVAPSRTWKTEVYWYWGPPGSGKTRAVFNLWGEFAYWKGATGKWFDGYDAHETVVLDDLRSTDFEFTFLLRLFDRYPLRVEIKHGTREFVAKRVYVTCPVKPETMFGENSAEDQQQLLRRLTQVVHFP